MSFARDTMLIFRRQIKLSLRNPAWVIIGLIQPILYLAFFGPLLSRVAAGAKLSMRCLGCCGLLSPPTMTVELSPEDLRPAGKRAPTCTATSSITGATFLER